MRFRGTIAGRLLMATKLLPARYITTTWLVSLAGLARDLARLRWKRTRDRIEVFRAYARNLPLLVRQRREIYHSARITPRKQVERLLWLATGGASVSHGRTQTSPTPGAAQALQRQDT